MTPVLDDVMAVRMDLYSGVFMFATFDVAFARRISLALRAERSMEDIFILSLVHISERCL
jgi:hypothetical protein